MKKETYIRVDDGLTLKKKTTNKPESDQVISVFTVILLVVLCCCILDSYEPRDILHIATSYKTTLGWYYNR